MSKILAVFGATGQQGSSVVNHVLNDAELAQEYKIRALTRDVNSPKAKELKEKAKVQVVEADMTNHASLKAALDGVHTVFIMTTPSFGPNAVETEFNTAKLIADTAVEQGVQYIIFSTLPSVTDISGGRYTHVTPFDAKAKAEAYIRTLPVKSAFTSLGYFMENLHNQPFLGIQPAPDGKWVLSRPVPSTTRLPYFYAVRDTGKFVGAILAAPDKYEGKRFHAAAALYSLDEIVAALAKSSGKEVVYKQVTYEEFGAMMPFAPDLWTDGFHAQEEWGYFGPGEEELVAWAVENARGRLATLDEFLEEHPVQLA
ncbi:NAD(P)-binding protein [Hypoxylon rubiginosum]|uniref:NAD(P)-binding protein n=1 Tax=Hypoxylon rubiginosum TaxID=110542 RepID=A0ACC0CVD6_9PEZI|nr:NAD(P)-binding protein [Hypoxylon rubiginosum]